MNVPKCSTRWSNSFSPSLSKPACARCSLTYASSGRNSGGNGDDACENQCEIRLAGHQRMVPFVLVFNGFNAEERQSAKKRDCQHSDEFAASAELCLAGTASAIVRLLKMSRTVLA